ncbi:MAG: protein kinase [Chloroflexi bacterium]|nr:protein kinase [Chloroflexota bacterium]
MNEITNWSGRQIDSYQVEKLVVNRDTTSLYLAREDGADTPVFLEILNATRGDDAELDGRFRQRMRTLSQLRHPGIAPILDLGHTPDNHSYAVIQHVSGVALSQKLSEWRASETLLTAQEALTLIRSLAAALAVAHPVGIVHHDLRPDNIILLPDNAPILIDLGVLDTPGKPAESVTQTTTLDYASPEQRQGKTISGRSNIYSLGVILYELLSGHPPEIPISSWDIFERTTLPKEVPLNQAQPGLTEETYKLVTTCLWRQEWSRFETVNALIKAIDAAILAEERQASQPEKTSRTRLGAYVAVPLTLIVIILAGFLLTQRETSPDDANAPSPPPITTVTPVTAVPTVTAATSVNLQPTTSNLQTATPAIAASQTPSPTVVEGNILLLAPSPGFAFDGNETIIFDWHWPLPLESDQQFSVYLITDNETRLVGVVTRSVSESQYRASIAISDLELTAGAYDWFVALESAPDGETLLDSEKQPFSVRFDPTATPTATETPTRAISSEDATATHWASCVPEPPSGWVSYTVQSGDFLFNLAIQTGTTVEIIQEANCLREPIIGAGQKIWLPSLPPTATPLPSPTPEAPTPEASTPKPKPPKPGVTKTAPPPP